MSLVNYTIKQCPTCSMMIPEFKERCSSCAEAAALSKADELATLRAALSKAVEALKEYIANGVPDYYATVSEEEAATKEIVLTVKLSDQRKLYAVLAELSTLAAEKKEVREPEKLWVGRTKICDTCQRIHPPSEDCPTPFTRKEEAK